MHSGIDLCIHTQFFSNVFILVVPVIDGVLILITVLWLTFIGLQYYSKYTPSEETQNQGPVCFGEAKKEKWIFMWRLVICSLSQTGQQTLGHFS